MPRHAPLRKEGEGFEFAKVVPDDTFRKRGALRDETLEMIVESAIEQFVYAAEDFIASSANHLGLTAAINPNNGLGLAA